MPVANDSTIGDFRSEYLELSQTDRFQREVDTLWASIRSKIGQDERTSLLICGSVPGEGSTTVTMGLGSFVANQTGRNVALVDAQWEGRLLGDLLGGSKLLPLIEEPEDKYTLTFEEFETTIPNMRYLKFRNPGSLQTVVVNSDETSILIGIIKKRYDYIFIDAPPVLSSNVAPFLARQVDGIIFVIAAFTLRHPMIKEAIARMGDSHQRILGVVLNKRRYPVPEYMYRFLR